MSERKYENVKLYMTANDFMDETFVSCECDNPAHAMMLSYYDDDINDYDPKTDNHPVIPELSFNLQLNPYFGFWKRLWVGIKYIFGYSYKGGHWNSCLVSEDNARTIIKYCNKFLDDCDKAKEIKEKSKLKN